MTSDVFNLTWNEFETSASNGYKELFAEKIFSDVTLVSEDEKQVQAHKVILSTCSPVFKQMLIQNPHPHPMIFMTGVNHQELLSLVNFMYLGETEVTQDNLEHFMDIAAKFKVKGLTKGKHYDAKEVFKGLDVINSQEFESTLPEQSSSKTSISMIDSDEHFSHSREFESKFTEQFNSKKSMIDADEHELKEELIIQENKEVDMTSIQYSNNLQKVYSRDSESYNFVENSNLNLSCDQCEYTATHISNLKRHKKARHDGVKFPCKHCDYKASYSHHLKTHKETKHTIA